MWMTHLRVIRRMLLVVESSVPVAAAPGSGGTEYAGAHQSDVTGRTAGGLREAAIASAGQVGWARPGLVGPCCERRSRCGGICAWVESESQEGLDEELVESGGQEVESESFSPLRTFHPIVVRGVSLLVTTLLRMRMLKSEKAEPVRKLGP
ncbi:unnamed protein product [Ectocarpus sp. CCAP 1310/34]|nr:unnamed protein product [Ectocarpus sp. CCAP 1310/34]